MNRSARVGALLLLAVVSAGCLGFITGSQALEFSANETVVSDAALEETGYQAASNSSIGDTLEVSAAGQTRQVNVTSYLHVYNRSVGLSDVNASAVGGAVPESGDIPTDSSTDGLSGARGANTTDAVQFSVLAAPTQRVGGRSVNPFAQFSTERLAKRFIGGTNSSSDLRLEGNRTVQSLGEDRTVSTFRTSDGDEQTANDVLVHVTTFETGNDFIVVVGAHPAAIDEQDRIDALVAGLEQPSS